MRLEPRRVLNADFTFTAQSGLSLSNVDGDLVVRTNSDRIEFDLAGSIWQDAGSDSPFSIDNSTANHSILSIDRLDFHDLTADISISAAPLGTHNLTFDTRHAGLDFRVASSLVVQDFHDVRQTGSHELAVNDFSVTANDGIELQRLDGDSLRFSSAELDFTGGTDSISATSLFVQTHHSSAIQLGGDVEQASVLDFTSTDLSALDDRFHSVRFEAIAADSMSVITVHSEGADFSDALTESPHEHVTHEGLHLAAESIRIEGALTVAADGLIDVAATHEVTISHSGSLVAHGGQILVDAGESGTLLHSGLIDVSNWETGSVGGTVHLLGGKVGLLDDGQVEASGHDGGGEVLIGGGLHGENDAVHNATHVFIGHDVEVNASAAQHGDGGLVVVWSDEVTQVYGHLAARGGALSGDGGFIETSSHGQLILTEGADASAAHGRAGTWLLDPFNVGIVLNSTIFGITEFAEPPLFNPTISGSEVTASAITSQLKTGTTVIISTENSTGSEAGDVTQAADALIDVVFDTAGDSATLIINAANSIFLNGGITASNGALNVILQANTGTDDLDSSAGDVVVNSTIDTNGGLFFSTGINFDSTGGMIAASGGVTITHDGTVDLGTIATGTGTGGTVFLSGATVHQAITVGEGNLDVSGGQDDLLILADLFATETMFLSAVGDVIVEATVTADGATSDLNITADAESDGVGGVWLREAGNVADAQLVAGQNVTIVGAELVASANADDSLRIDGDGANQQVVAGHDLTLLANFGSLSMAGDIIIDGLQTTISGSLTAFFTGITFLGADQSAGTDILFQNAVQLTNDVLLTSGNDVTFGSTLDDDANDATGSALTIEASGNVLFVGEIGANAGDRLDTLTVTGEQFIDFLDAVAIDGDILVTGNSEVHTVTFQGPVTTTAGLATGSVTITNAGLLVISSQAEFSLAGSFTQDGLGTTELGADITTQDGDVTFEQAVLLTESVTIDTSAGSADIRFQSAIDSEANPLDAPVDPGLGEHNSLTLTAGTGTILFNGDIGALPDDLGELTHTLGDLTVTTADMLTIGDPVTTIRTNGAIDLGSDDVIANGIVIEGGPLPDDDDPDTVTIQSDAASIRVNGPVTSDVNLVVNAATGVTLTDDGSIVTSDFSLVINGDLDGDGDGDLEMGELTQIDVGDGFIDLSAANVVLGALTSASENGTDADNPAIRVVATYGSISDGNDDELNITANTRFDADEPGAGVVLMAVTGIGSGDALETDIASLFAFNHDHELAPDDVVPAEGNIEIVDAGSTTGRLDLIFVRNQANPADTQDPDNGVIDILVEDGDLRVVDDQSLPLLLEMRRGLDDFDPPDFAVPAVQSENTIRLTANTIEIFDDLLAIQDTELDADGFRDDNGIGEFIEINARVNFVLGNDCVITTDENYVNSLNLGEDLNGNGVLDSGEDTNGNGDLDTFPDRGFKPAIFADDPNKDVIHITADVDLNGDPNGNVFLGIDSTISTDSGIEQRIAPRPELLSAGGANPVYTDGSAFFSGVISVSNLESRLLSNGTIVYLGTLTFTIGVPGEKNLVLDIDWGDLTPTVNSDDFDPDLHENQIAPTLRGSVYAFDASVDQHATRFLIPEGGARYSIPHEYTQNALNLKGETGGNIEQPGRTLTTDPLQVRFAVSQHPSILIEGQTVTNPDGSGVPAVPLNAPYDSPTEPNPLTHDDLFVLSSTDVLDNEDAFFPRFDNGLAAFVLPTTIGAPAFPIRDAVIAPPELPKPVFQELLFTTPPQLTTESTATSAVSSSVTTDEFFELREVGEDDNVIRTERLSNFQGDGLLEKDRFEEFIRDKGDGTYEIWFIKRETGTGAVIERQVIRFRLEAGRLAPPPDDSPTLFKPFRLIPLPAVPEAMPDDTEDGTDRSDTNSAEGSAATDLSTDDNAGLAALSSNDAGSLTTPVRVDDAAMIATEIPESSSSNTAALAAGILVFASERCWRRSSWKNSSAFSKAARWTRQQLAKTNP